MVEMVELVWLRKRMETPRTVVEMVELLGFIREFPSPPPTMLEMVEIVEMVWFT